MKYIRSFYLLFIFLSGIIQIIQAQEVCHYLNPDLSFEERVKDLISRMTLDEKISQVHNQLWPDTKGIPRLGIKDYGYWGEALHGIGFWKPATVFPQANALACTWNPERIQKMTEAIGKEARVFNNQSGKGLTYFSPTINMARDPRWGRNEEAYSEDPLLTAKLGVAFVKGLQGYDPNYLQAVATVKHFVADNSEFNRNNSSSYIDMRDLREYYFPAYEATVKEANVQSVMATYRGLNGIPNCANKWLLDKVLRQEWGFEGYVVSDCWAIKDIAGRQQYVSEQEKSVQLTIRAGTDLNCGDCYRDYLHPAVEKGYVSEQEIDLLLGRVLKSRMMLGEFDPDERVPYKSIPDSILNCQEHQQLALNIARESMVLMKNDNQYLPLKKNDFQSVAIIGVKAGEPEYGAYTGFPNQAVTILQGIQHKLGAAVNGFEEILADRFTRGSYINRYIEYFSDSLTQIIGLESNAHLLQVRDGDWIMFRDIDLGNGAKAMSVTAACKGQGGWVEIRLNDPAGKLIGKIRIEDTGSWEMLQSIEGKINKTTGIHDVYLTFRGDTENEDTLFNLGTIQFIPVKTSYKLTPTPVQVRYAKGCDVNTDDRSGFEEAIGAARESDLVIFVYGTDRTIASEARDPANLEVPSLQRELLKEIYAVNPNIVLLLAVGIPLIIDWEKDHIPAILATWFGGQSQGEAAADILFGDYNPGGKLPATWYSSENQLPPFTCYHIRKNNRTYQYFTGKVLFPFGHGLSYTKFEYNIFNTGEKKYRDSDKIRLKIDITNKGNVAGEEVVQIYSRDIESSVKTPNKKLVAFQRVHLQPGETRRIEFNIDAINLGFWDIKRNDFIVETGDFMLMAGSSSEDIRQSGIINVQGKTYEQGIIRINAGGDYYVDETGLEWMPDYGFDFGLHATTEKPVENAFDPMIFQTCRKRCDASFIRMDLYTDTVKKAYNWKYNICDTTSLSYSFEVLNGKYDVNLYFTELECLNEQMRVFDIEIENRKVAKDFDIYRETGYHRAMKLSFPDIEITDGYMDIRFLEKTGFPCVSGIEIVPADLTEYSVQIP